MTNDAAYSHGKYAGLIAFSEHMLNLAKEFEGTPSAGFCNDCAVKAQSFAEQFKPFAIKENKSYCACCGVERGTDHDSTCVFLEE